MGTEKTFKISFRLIGVYDVLLGLVFVLFFREIYHALGITLPNHPGYIFVPAWFIVCGGIAEFLIAQNPLRNVDLVLMRLLMKLSFAVTVVYCHFVYGIPTIFLLISLLSVIGVVKNVMFLKWAKSAVPTA